MGVTVQVRNLDAGVQQRLRHAAEREGLSLSEFLRRKLTDLAVDLEVQERLTSLGVAQNTLGGPLQGMEHISSEEIVRMIREDRDNR